MGTVLHLLTRLKKIKKQPSQTVNLNTKMTKDGKTHENNQSRSELPGKNRVINKTLTPTLSER